MQTINLTFNDFYNIWKWKEIPNCPGRYTIHPQKTNSLNVKEFLIKTGGIKIENEIIEYENTNKKWIKKWNKGEIVRDILWIIKLENNCGILSYEHNKTGGFLHTLNNESGFKRKLEALNIYKEIFPHQE